MIERLQKNGWKALSEVVLSIAGTIGIFFLISCILALQSPSSTIGNIFGQYFSGGQIGISVLSLSGIILTILLGYGPIHKAVSVLLYVIFFFPLLATALIIGLNPGFLGGKLNSGSLTILWFVYFGMHILWFVILILEPEVPSAQVTGKAEQDRVNDIKGKADARG
jgi:hypothetical protein